MRAVIFAAAVLAGASGWLLLDTEARAPQSPVPALAQADGPSSLRNQFRADRARCKLGEIAERALCERHARERVHARLRREAAKISFR